MKRDDWMLLTLTFLTGLAIGMYVYIMFFKPTYAPENLNTTESEASEWSLVGTRRSASGMDSRSYPSFRLLGDRSYVYLPGGEATEQLSPQEGRISAALMRELRAADPLAVDHAALANLTSCRGDSQGFEYEYHLTIDSTMYLLDTCETNLGNDTQLALLLQRVWAEIEGVRQARTYSSFSDWLEDWLRQNLSVKE